MYGERLLERLRNLPKAGELAPPALTVRVENPVCGDVLQLSVRVDHERVVEARFKAQGCPPTIACGSLVAEWLEGRSLKEASGLNAARLEQELGGLPAASRHAAALAVDAVRAVVAQFKASEAGEASPPGAGS